MQDPPSSEGHPLSAAVAADPLDARAIPVAVLLLALLFVQGLAFIGESSQTSDEAGHLLAGYSYLRTGTFLMYPGEPPLMKEIAALPLLALDLDFPEAPPGAVPAAFRLGRVFVHENRVSNDTILLLARLPMLGLSLLLGWAIFAWGRRLFGSSGGLLALALYALDPNVVAHSCVVMTDLGVTLFIFLSVYALWCWSERPTRRSLVLLGFALGGAFASKYTALWLLPILGTLGIALIGSGAPLPARPWSSRPDPVPADQGRAARPVPRRILSLTAALAGAGAIAVLVLAASYAGRGLPAYLAGFDVGMRHTSTGSTAYLMGRVSEKGWWYFFLFAYLVKTPIGTLLILALAIAASAQGARRRRLRDEIFLWIPIAMIVLITCLWKVNIGLRHFLPIYPFLCLTSGRVAAPPAAGARRGWVTPALRWAVIVCLGWNVVEATAIAPYDLTYFNQLVGGPRNGHLYLLDSNLDWGQGVKALRRYVASVGVPVIDLSYAGNTDPFYYRLAYQYVPGIGNFENERTRSSLAPDGMRRDLLAVSAMALHFVRLGEGTLYDWLKTRPVIAMPANEYMVYDITGDADGHARLAALYLASRMPDLALAEARRALRIDPANRPALAVQQRLAAPPSAP